MLRIRLKAHENGAGQSRIISVIEILERGDFFWDGTGYVGPDGVGQAEGKYHGDVAWGSVNDCQLGCLTRNGEKARLIQTG